MEAEEAARRVPFTRVSAYIAGLYLRRFGNRMASVFRGKKAEGARTGLGRKSVGESAGAERWPSW